MHHPKYCQRQSFRREADRLIEAGKVTVDGETATMGMQVNGQEKIIVNKKPVFGKNEKVVLAYYKPVGVTCTEKDRHAERKICDELNYPVRLTYAGRLDKDSEGLLIMTNDGDLIPFPASISRSASLLEQTPQAARYLFKRSFFSSISILHIH